MNKVYKVVWNASLGIWVAVSELAKGKTKSRCSVEASCLQNQQLEDVSLSSVFNYKILSLAIFTVFTANFAFAGYEAGGGSTFANCTRTSAGSGAEGAGIAIANENSIACAPAVESLAIGANIAALGAQSTVVGNDVIASTTATQSVVIGSNFNANPTTSNGKGGVAIGSGLSAIHKSPIADGQGSLALGSSGDGTAINGTIYDQQGPDAKAAYSAALMAGSQTAIGADRSIAFGVDAKVAANTVDSIALGTTSATSANNTVAIGKNANANVLNSVALGAGSTTTAQAGNSFLTNVAPSATNGVVSVGTTSATRRIQNVADGAALTDAVNVAQLDKAYDDAHSRLATALGGGAAYDPATNAYTVPNYNVTTDPNAGTKTGNVNNVGAALSGLDTAVNKAIIFNANAGSSTNKLGSTLNITGGLAGTGSNANVKTVITGNTVDIQIADAPTFSGTVTAGNLATGGTLSVTGVSNLNGGANLNNQKITNLAAGTAPGDAVNFSQLTTTNNNVTTAQNTANTALTNANNAQTSANAAQSTANNALTEAQKGLNFRANAGATDKVSLGETITLADGTNTTATYDAATNTYKYNVVDAPTFAGTVTAGNLATGGTLRVTGVSNLNGGANLNNQKITNVAAGTAPGDAVNFSQLTTTNNNVTTAQNTANTALTNANNALTEAQKGLNFSVNGGAGDNVKLGETVNFANGTNTTATYDAATNTYKYNVVDAPTFAGTVTAGNLATGGTLSVTGVSNLNGGANLNNQKITNVAAGTAPGDAVNFSQLTTTNNNVTTAQNTANTALTNANNAQTSANAAQSTANNALTEAQKGLNFRANAGATDKVSLGETITLADGTNTTATYDAATNTYKYNVVDAPTFAGTVTAGNLATGGTLSVTGVSNLNGGANLNNQKITNVAAGTAPGDAVNFSQLTTTNNNVTTAQNTANTALTNANNAQTSANAAQSTANTALSEAQKGIKFGDGTTSNNYALGETINVKGDSNVNSVTTADGVQLSLASDIVLDSVTTGNSKLDNSGLVITGGPSITTAGIDAANTNISNVADATTADQAVNKGQLDAATAAADGKTDALGNSTANNLGGGATYNSTTGAVTAPTYSVNGTDVNNVGAAISELDKGWNLASNGANAGAIKAGDTVDIGTAAGETNLQVAKSGNTIQYSLSRDLDLDSVTTGNSKLDNSGLVITGGPSITTAGIDAANTNISNVADATTADQAVNKGQLDAAAAAADGKTDALGNSTANNLGGGATYNSTTGAVTAPTYSVNGTDVNNVGAAISELDKGWNLASNGANAGAIKAGDTVDIGVADPTDSNLTATKTGNNVAFALSKDLTLDSVTTGQIAVGNVAIDSTTNTIKGLSNKDLTAADFATQGRAATEEQLQQVISNNITEVVDGNGNKVNIIDQVVNTQPDNKNQDSLFLTYDKQGQETTDRLTIAQTVQKMNTEGVKFFHTNADTSKGDLGTTNDSSAGGLNSTAIGVNAIVEAGADSSVALGHNTKVAGAQSIAIGNGAEALGTQSISIGTGNKVNGDHSGAIGDPTIVDGSNSYSVGNNNQVLTDDTFVLGNNVTQTVAGSVVLGTGSAATTGAGVAGYTLSAATTADKTAISNTTSTTGAVAVGDAANGIYRQITGVAAGTADADAVNVAQLKAVGNQVVETQTALVDSIGGNAKVNADGTITGPTYNVAQGTQTNVGDALTALDQAIGNAATTSKTTVSNGENIVVNKTKNADGSDNYEVSTAKDLTVDSIAAGDTVLNNSGINIGNNAVVLNNTGLVIAGGPSVTTQGINAGNKQITNVAAGTSATDAVNKGQLDTAISNVNNNVNELANNAVKYDDANKDKITLGGANGTTISNVKDGEVAQGSKDAVNGGQLWNVQQQVNQNTSDISNIQTNIDNINSGKSGLVQQQTPNGEITVGKDTGGTTVNVAGKDGDRVVTGVKDGAIKADSKDAVNGSQLNTTNQKIAEYLGGGAGYDNITQSFTNPTYNVGGKDYNNVGGAVDALNKADQALNTKIDNVSNRLEQAFYSTNQRIDDVEKRANAGIAAAMALETAPFVPGKYTYAAGASYHGGENAVGVTLRKTADNGRWSITGGVAAASQGDPSVRIGISGVID
ncbi:ESPR-type extended signal peptide-containing protein [Acinetobacter pittii]|uniref:ESPR-type extended signal peptide-containing protein n=3 Tax=Acinetobacter calcoaceticus/baumannii complex TaxID=909768 RepID=UPI003A83C281